MGQPAANPVTTYQMHGTKLSRVVVTEEQGVVPGEVLDLPDDPRWQEPIGVVYFDVHEHRDGQWLTYAQTAAPLSDIALRTAAATEALRLADEAAQALA